MKKLIFVAVIVLLALVVVALAFFRRSPFAYSGVIEAVQIDVPSRLNDVLIKRFVDEGSPVTKGMVLAQLECKQVNLQAAIAQKEFNRAATLLKTSAGSQENYDNKKNAYDNAVLAQSWCRILSPVDGKTLYKYYEEGEFVTAGKKVVTVADLKTVDAWVYVEHDKLASLSVGQKVTGHLPEADKSFDGRILTINDEAEFTPKNVQTRKERERLVFGVKVRFDNDDSLTLKPGMTVEINF